MLAVLALLLTGVLTPARSVCRIQPSGDRRCRRRFGFVGGQSKKPARYHFWQSVVLLPLGHSELLLTAVIMLAIGTLSAFINNTAAVAVFIPVVLEVCRRTKVSPGRVLMPMSHAATIGGMCTLVGTSTNLVAHEYARSQGLAGFSMFELGKVGIPMIVLAYAYMLFVGRLFLPKNESTELTASGSRKNICPN